MNRTENKKVSDSVTESSKIIQSKDINGQSRLFGGRLLEWIDEVGALTAMRHCESESVVLMSHPTALSSVR